jgi:calpain-7
MITVGTGKLTYKEEKELGLAGEHDYAVLDMRGNDSQRLILMKNPWCDGMVWKGSVSNDLPTEDSTRELEKALPNTSTTPGTFWMRFEDIIQHFESLYLNWNPGLFRYRQDHHFAWVIPTIKCPGSFTHNPQYTFKPNRSCVVWILLSRHFATGEQDIVGNTSSGPSDTSSALGFISLYVFTASGQRVFLSDDAIHRGAFVDSPQTLASLDVIQNTDYTVVVAQHGLPLPKYSFTLSFFSRSPLIVGLAQDGLPHYTSHNRAWTLRTAGGNASAETYPINPQFSLSIPSISDIVLTLETDQEELAVHVQLAWGNGERVTAVTARDIVGGSGDYRRGCALATLHNVAAGKYTIVCSTFEPGQLGNFTLRVDSREPCEVRPIPSELAGRLSLRLPPLIVPDNAERMLAPMTVSRMTRLRIVARSGDGDRFTQSRPLLKISLEMGQGPNKTILDISNRGEFSDAPMGIRTADLDVSPEMSLRGGIWIVVERLGGGTGHDFVIVDVLSDGAVSVDIWGIGDG